MVFGHPEHHKEPGALPVGLAELPKTAAERIHTRGRHVDRAEAAMRGKVGCPELGRPKSGERLTLITAGEEGKLFRVLGMHRRQPSDCRRDRLLPLDFSKLAGAALADAGERFPELCRRVLLHDPGCALAADYAAIDRVIAIPFDVTNTSVLEMNFDAAPAGTHVAGRAFDLVGHFWRGIKRLVRRKILAQPAAKSHCLPPDVIARTTLIGWLPVLHISIELAGWFTIGKGKPDLEIEPPGPRMQRHGETVERAFEPHLLANRIVRIEEALRGLVPQSLDNGIDQVVGGIGGDHPKRVKPDGRCRDSDPRISVGGDHRALVRAALFLHGM